jgi:hypothetical protein
LNVEPLKNIQDKERSRANAALLFLRKHAAVIKKNMLIASINYNLRSAKCLENQAHKSGEKFGGNSISKNKEASLPII